MTRATNGNHSETVELSRLEKIGPNQFVSEKPTLGWKRFLDAFEVPGLGTFRKLDTTGWDTRYVQENGEVKIQVFID